MKRLEAVLSEWRANVRSLGHALARPSAEC